MASSIEGGPDSFLATKPRGIGLCEELGIGERRMHTARRQAATTPRVRPLAWPAHDLPEGLSGLVPTRLAPLARSSLLSPPGKAPGGPRLPAPRPTCGRRRIARRLHSPPPRPGSLGASGRAADGRHLCRRRRPVEPGRDIPSAPRGGAPVRRADQRGARRPATGASSGQRRGPRSSRRPAVSARWSLPWRQRLRDAGVDARARQSGHGRDAVWLRI